MDSNPMVNDSFNDELWDKASEHVLENTPVRYELRVFVDDTLVFKSDYADDMAMQEDLHKVDGAIENELADLTRDYLNQDRDWDNEAKAQAGF